MLFLHRRLYITLEWFLFFLGTPMFVLFFHQTYVSVFSTLDHLPILLEIIISIIIAVMFSIVAMIMGIILFGQFFAWLSETAGLQKYARIVPMGDDEIFFLWADEYYPELSRYIKKNMKSSNNGLTRDANLRNFIHRNIHKGRDRNGSGFRKTRKYIKTHEHEVAWMLL